jgi:hypothetical protein
MYNKEVMDIIYESIGIEPLDEAKVFKLSKEGKELKSDIRKYLKNQKDKFTTRLSKSFKNISYDKEKIKDFNKWFKTKVQSFYWSDFVEMRLADGSSIYFSTYVCIKNNSVYSFELDFNPGQNTMPILSFKEIQFDDPKCYLTKDMVKSFYNIFNKNKALVVLGGKSGFQILKSTIGRDNRADTIQDMTDFINNKYKDYRVKVSIVSGSIQINKK